MRRILDERLQDERYNFWEMIHSVLGLGRKANGRHLKLGSGQDRS